MIGNPYATSCPAPTGYPTKPEPSGMPTPYQDTSAKLFEDNSPCPPPPAGGLGMMGEHGGSTMGTARDLRAQMILALISCSTIKVTAGRAATLVEEAHTIMALMDHGNDPCSNLLQRLLFNLH